MRAREVARRMLLWVGVAVFFVANVWAVVASAAADFTGLVGFSAFPIVGAIILSSRPGNGVGRLLYLIGMFWIFGAVGSIDALLLASPAWFESVVNAAAWPGWVIIPLIGLLFPTGRIETRAGRVLGGLLVGYSLLAAFSALVIDEPLLGTGRANSLAWPAAQPFAQLVLGPGIALFVATIVGIIVDLAVRWRRSTGATRLQYRWLVWGLTLVVVIVASSGLLHLLLGNDPVLDTVTGFFVLSINLIPISIGIAVTRHGLYEIGRVVSRTVAYTIVTLLVVGVYALIVVSLTRLLPNLPSVGVALATLIAAALFLPALRFVQRWVDRRFDRERYDAGQVVDAFGEHLRTEVNPDQTSVELTQAVEQTLQPASIGIWTAGGMR